MKFDKLKNKMFEKRKTYKDCADMLNISVVAFSNKINGYNEFKVTEAIRLSEFLTLTPEESYEIFFIK
ncbi:toxin-antitoxin system, antitoxin component, Xre family protein [Gemella sp. ND 6198]|uniref:toxin-antitoxin system, antitoxin component, Xre family protein n=1 Tax=Gemella sp. ND 6198 TaxID=2040624 RepID=UPI000E0C8486|nr:toxin-antitoxin system, antitoxin component, Xre family protein [Gemella sp. ND 6198]AXI27295.1 toxin-antitoxin system, antitoxin component, Xre family protein [Gemella sp. ND 6198]